MPRRRWPFTSLEPLSEMDRLPRALLVAVGFAVATGGLAACSGDDRVAVPVAAPTSSPMTAGGPTAGAAAAARDVEVCRFNREIAIALGEPADAAGRLAVLQSFEPRFDQIVRDAPPEIRLDVERLVVESRKAIRAGDLASLSPEDFERSGRSLDAYCGVGPP